MTGAPVTVANQKEIFSLLIEQEEWTAQLYLLYQSLFTELDAFWGRLVAEERGHAAILSQLEGKIDQTTYVFDPAKFNATGLRTSCEHIRKQLQIASTDPITLMRALATAVDLETSLIEKDFYKVVASDSVVARLQFQKLTEDSQAHRQRLVERLAEERKLQGCG